MYADLGLNTLLAASYNDLLFFYAVYDVCEIYVMTSMPYVERGRRLSLSDSGRNVNNARVSVRRPCVSNLKNQIFCHLRVNSFCRRRLTATLALAGERQLSPHLQ